MMNPTSARRSATIWNSTIGKKRIYPTRQSLPTGARLTCKSSINGDDALLVRWSSASSSSQSTSTTTTNTKKRSDQMVTRFNHATPTSDISSPSIVVPESADATKLVDDLLEYTRSLMGHPSNDADAADKQQQQQQQLQHVIAYSGGIDSSVVAALVFQSATTSERETVQAVLGLSPAVPSEQVVLAEEVAQHIGVSLVQIPTTEGNDDVYIENAGQACLACKTHLYTCLETIVKHTEAGAGGNEDGTTSIAARLYNGTNADDLQDPTRLGLIAAERHDVQSPLRYTTKEQVRLAGRHLGLPNWNYAASPCLRSRLAIGVEAIPQHLKRIEQAERHVRRTLNLDATHNMRVRLLAKNKAMVEVEADVLESAKGCLQGWRVYFSEALGFLTVDVRQFKSGSVAPRVADDGSGGVGSSKGVFGNLASLFQ